RIYGFLPYMLVHSSIFTLSLHDALPICTRCVDRLVFLRAGSADQNSVTKKANQNRPFSAYNNFMSNILEIQKIIIMKLWLNHSRSEEHTSELQSRVDIVCRLLLEKKNEQ